MLSTLKFCQVASDLWGTDQLGRLLDVSWASWAPLGPNLAALGRLLAALGRILDGSWANLDASWANLDVSWTPLGRLLDASWAYLDASWPARLPAETSSEQPLHAPLGQRFGT